MRQQLTRWGMPVLAALGLADSTYLAVLHLSGEIPPCGGYGGCAAVNSSPYAELFGVPVALFGAAMYLALLFLALWRIWAGAANAELTALLLYSLALASGIVVVYLTAIEVFVLHDYCYWCLALALNSLVLLGLATRDARRAERSVLALYPRPQRR